MQPGTDAPTAAFSDPGLLRVLEAARDFLVCRDRLAAVRGGQVAPARSLAEAIGRDFLPFDLERATEALREAVAAAQSTQP